MHLPPTAWGPFFWHTMHIVALGYPSKAAYSHKKAAKDFFESLQFLIPCPICREHYSQFLHEHPITPFLDRRDDLFKWTVLIHNEVNTKLGKPRVTELESIEFYKRLGKQNRSPVFGPDDFAEADLRALIKGVAIGIGLTMAVGGMLWFLNKGES
jgi:hypothetical protein